MSEQAMTLKRSLQIVRRQWVLVSIFAALGLLAGAGYTALDPPLLSSNALVVLSPSTHDTRTQVVIAGSDPVLSRALRQVGSGMSLQTLRSRIQVKSPSYNVISISAEAKRANQAERTANAVASSYVTYVSSSPGPGVRAQAQVFQPATDATGPSLAVGLLDAAGPGLVLGALIGAVIVLAIGRSDRRMRERGQIANSIGAPVLASIFVDHPSGTAGWEKLLEEYEPGAVDGWRLRLALQYLHLADGNGGGPSLAVLSLSSDRKALSLGPQLAVFAASTGISTTLVLGPQQDASATAALRAACTGPLAQSLRSRNLRLAVSDDDNGERLPRASLRIVVAVVNDKTPRVADTMRAATTVLGVSAGAATAEQLASVAASAAADGRSIAGIFVADPDPADHTTGRLSQLAQPVQRRVPTHQPTATPTETRQ